MAGTSLAVSAGVVAGGRSRHSRSLTSVLQLNIGMGRTFVAGDARNVGYPMRTLDADCVGPEMTMDGQLSFSRGGDARAKG